MHRREEKQGEKGGQNKKREREYEGKEGEKLCRQTDRQTDRQTEGQTGEERRGEERRGEERRGEEQREPNKSQHFFCILIRAVLPNLCLNQTPGELCGSRHQQTERPELQSSDISPLSSLRLKQLDTDHSLFHISSRNKVMSRPIKKTNFLLNGMVALRDESRCQFKALWHVEKGRLPHFPLSFPSEGKIQ